MDGWGYNAIYLLWEIEQMHLSVERSPSFETGSISGSYPLFISFHLLNSLSLHK